MKRIAIASPFRGDTLLNLRYLRACMSYALGRGVAPFAGHGLYTQPGVLDDTDAEQRELGKRAGHVWIRSSEALWVFIDLGISRGMIEDIAVASKAGVPVEHYQVPGWES